VTANGVHCSNFSSSPEKTLWNRSDVPSKTVISFHHGLAVLASASCTVPGTKVAPKPKPYILPKLAIPSDFTMLAICFSESARRRD
jgi:hypothetical protein